MIRENKAQGYIRLYRSVIGSQVFQDEGLFHLFIWCLLQVAYKPQWVSVKTGRGNKQIKLEAGQFIFGRTVAAKALNKKASTIRNRIKRLIAAGILTLHANGNFSIATVCNWEAYQAQENSSPPATRPPDAPAKAPGRKSKPDDRQALSERADLHVTNLIKISDYATTISRSKALVQAIQTCKKFSDELIIQAITDIGKNAKSWGLVNFRLKAIEEERQKKNDANQAAERQCKETMDFLTAQRAKLKA